MSLTLFHSALATAPLAAAPDTFDDTRSFTVTETYDIGRYLFTGSYVQSPVTGTIVHLFHNGNRHEFDSGKKVCCRKSMDNGLTFGTIADVANPTDGGVQDVNGGYSHNGRLHIFYDVHQSFSGGVQHWMRYTYSDDDGTTWAAPVTLSGHPDGFASFRVMGKLIENNGVLLKPYYAFTDEGDFSSSARLLLRSIDNGTTWQHVIVEQSTDFINEGALLAWGNELLYISRIENQTGYTSSQRYKIYKSSDNGIAWSVQGITAFGESFSYAHPVWLEKFKLKNTTIAACYLHNRGTKDYKVIYGKIDDVMGGISGWNLNTKQTLFNFNSYAGAARSGYGAFAHITDDLFARGMAYVDLGNKCEVLYMDLPTTHHTLLINEFGL
jgi:hypothetical protein